MADVHSKATRSYNNLSRFSGLAALKAGIQSLKCWCGGFYMPMATGTGYTIKTSPANLVLFYQTQT
jgi:hypothetical protein